MASHEILGDISMYSSGSREAELPHWSHCSTCRWVEQMHHRMHSESGWVRTAWQRESANIMRIDAVETRVDVPRIANPNGQDWVGIETWWCTFLSVTWRKNRRKDTVHSIKDTIPDPYHGANLTQVSLYLFLIPDPEPFLQMFSSPIVSDPPSNLLLILSSY